MGQWIVPDPSLGRGMAIKQFSLPENWGLEVFFKQNANSTQRCESSSCQGLAGISETTSAVARAVGCGLKYVVEALPHCTGPNWEARLPLSKEAAVW